MKRLAILGGVGLIGLWGIYTYGPAAAYYGVNKWRTSAVDTELTCNMDTWSLPGFRAEAPGDGEYISLRPNGSCTLGFVLKQGQPRVKKGFRTELRTNAVPFGLSHQFCFRVHLPAAWDAASPPVTIVQWHAVPDRLLGEAGRSPPLRLMIEKGQWSVTHAHDDRRNSSSAEAGEIFFSTTFQAPVDWGEDTDWCFDVRWDEDAKGAYAVRMNGVDAARHEGPFGYRDWIAPFLKFGVYIPKADELPGGEWRAEFSAITIQSEDD